MLITKKNFSKTLQEKILSDVKKRQLDIQFLDGALKAKHIVEFNNIFIDIKCDICL